MYKYMHDTIIMFYFLLQASSFQAALITNGYQSFAVFTYHCPLLQWSGNALIGFRADEHFHEENNAQTITCSNGTLWHNVVYRLCE